MASSLKNLPDKKVALTEFCQDISQIDQAPRRSTDELAHAPVDRIVISKERKKLYLLSQRQFVKEYDVAFGFGFQDGAKSQQDDGRTPEGLYKVQLKKSVTNYYKALQVSYPNADDIAFARANGVQPGGSILIHGFPTRPVDGLIPAQIPGVHPQQNWTQGCVAVTNEEITEIYSLVKTGVAIEICPLSVK